MSKATADAKRVEMKAATNKLAAKGIQAPKHARHDKSSPAATTGVDDAGDSVVKSVPDAANSMSGIVNHLTGPSTMKKTPEELQAAKATAKLAAEQAKATKKAESGEAAKAKLAEALKVKEAKAAAKEANIAAKAAEAAAKKAERAARVPKVRDPASPMGALADASTRYTKGENGQLNNGDELAQALGKVPAAQVVGVVLQTLGLAENPYPHLNYGQQSMNLRNKLRGAIRKNAKIGEAEDAPHVTLDRVKHFVDVALAAAPAADAAE